MEVNYSSFQGMHENEVVLWSRVTWPVQENANYIELRTKGVGKSPEIYYPN